MPQPCSRRRLGLTFETATASVLDISSAGTGRGDRNRSAGHCVTVGLMPQRVPISPQWRMNFWATGVSGVFVLSLISVITECTVQTSACQALFSALPSCPKSPFVLSYFWRGPCFAEPGPSLKAPGPRLPAASPALVRESQCGLPCLHPAGSECPTENPYRTARADARARCLARFPPHTLAAASLRKCPRRCLQFQCATVHTCWH